MDTRQNLLYHACSPALAHGLTASTPHVGGAMRGVPLSLSLLPLLLLPIFLVPIAVAVAVVHAATLQGRSFSAKVEDPAGDEAAENRYVGHDDGDVVFNVVDAVVDWVGPVGIE